MSHAEKRIAMVLTVLVALLATVAEGDWIPAATVWIHRAVTLIAVASSVMGWGVVAPRRAP